MVAKEKLTPCPCGSGKSLDDCCGRFLDGGERPATAEALMRSRYTAFALGNAAYLLDSWHAATRPDALAFDSQPAPKWIGLKVLRHEQLDATHAIVEFAARYKVNGRAFMMRETSRFVQEDGRWYYVDGDTADASS